MNQLAHHIGKLATQQASDPVTRETDPRVAARGEARAAALTPAKRKKIAKKAAAARWGKKR